MTILCSTVIILIASSYISYRNSLTYSLGELTSSLKTRNYSRFKNICPKFTNQKKVTKGDFNRFYRSIEGRITEEEVKKIFLDTSSFRIVNAKKWYKKKYFYPKPKYLNVKKADENSISNFEVVIENDVLNKKKNDKFGPVIAGNYSVTYVLNNEKYGSAKILKKEDLNENHTFILDDTSLYLHDSKFQNYLVSRISNYFSSMGTAISSGLNFNELNGTTERQKNDVIQSFETLKPHLEKVDQKYQKIILNNSSLKFIDSSKNKISFDIYTDYKLELHFKPVEDIPLGLSISNGNAIATLVFDSDVRQWLVESIDFETYNQNPEDWEEKRVMKADNPTVNQWETNQLKNTV